LLRTELLSEVYPSAKAFFELAESQYFPSFRALDPAHAGDLAFGSLRSSYEAHRNAVDKLTRSANANYQQITQDADEIAKTRLAVLLVISLCITTVTAAFGYFVTTQIGPRAARPRSRKKRGRRRLAHHRSDRLKR